MHQHGQSSETICWAKWAERERFASCRISQMWHAKTTHFIYGDRKQVRCFLGLRVRGWLMTKGTKEVSRWRNVLHLIAVVLTQIYTLVKAPLIIHLKSANSLCVIHTQQSWFLQPSSATILLLDPYSEQNFWKELCILFSVSLLWFFLEEKTLVWVVYDLSILTPVVSFRASILWDLSRACPSSWTHFQQLSQYCRVAGSSPAVSFSASSSYLDHWILEADASGIQSQGLNCHLYAGDSQSSISSADLSPEFHIRRTSYFLTTSTGCITHTPPLPVCTLIPTEPPAAPLPSRAVSCFQFLKPQPRCHPCFLSQPHSHSFEILLTLLETYPQNLRTLCGLISNQDTVV